MELGNLAQDAARFIQEHQAWGPFIVAALAFGESLIVISFFVPAVGILVALGGAAGAAGGVAFLPLWVGVVIGASVGNLVSWYVGAWYGDAFRQWKPIRDRQATLDKAEAVFRRFGVAAIFIGRFFGPLHGTVATLAALSKMNPVVFHVANWLSAMVWATVVLYGSMLGGEQARRLMSQLLPLVSPA